MGSITTMQLNGYIVLVLHPVKLWSTILLLILQAIHITQDSFKKQPSLVQKY